MASINGCQWTLLITAAANRIACGLDDDSLAFAAASLTQLGDTLAAIAAQRALEFSCPEVTEPPAYPSDNRQTGGR